jgi:outer membrane lipoprotein SlyB
MLRSLLVGLLLLVGACAGMQGQEPIVDLKGVSQAQYDTDLAECKAYAEQVQAGRKVAGGAVVGAVLGGVLGAVVGDHDTAARGAGVGGIVGGAKGAGSAAQERRKVLRTCLVDRGYRVLN